MMVPNLQNRICEPRYDTQPIATGTVTVRFFQTPNGQGTGVFQAAAGTNAKTYADTNMDTAGSLPAGYAFQINAVRLAWTANITLADAKNVFNAAVFEFWIGSKPFLRTRASTIPAGPGPTGIAFQAMAALDALLVNGWPVLSNQFGLGEEPLYVGPTENFYALLYWPGLTPTITTTGFNPATNLPVICYLDGYLGRPVQ